MNAQDLREPRTPLTRYCSPIAMLVVMTLATVAISFCMFKFPPILKYIMSSYEVREGQSGLLMSSSNVIGFIFAISIGYMNRRYKPKWTGLLGFLIMAVANIIAVSTSSFSILIVSRIIEGAGMGIVSNLTSALVVNYFKGHRATATAIVNAGMTAGQVLHFNVAPRLYESTGSFTGIYTYIIITFFGFAAVLFLFLRREPSMAAYQESLGTGPAPSAEEIKAKRGIVLRSRDLWFIAVAMFIFNIVMVSFNNYLPTLLVDKGMDNITASGYVSLASSIRTFVMIAMGFIADKLGSKRKPAMLAYIGIAVMYLVLGSLSGSLIMIWVLMAAVFPSPVTTMTYSCYPDIFGDASYTAPAHGVVQTMARLSMLLGSTIVGYIVQYFGYATATYIMVPIAVVGAIMWFLAKKVK